MGRVTKIVGLKACSLVTAIRKPTGVPILAYHAIDDSGSYLSTSPLVFEAEMACLKRMECIGISISRIMSMVQGEEEIPPKTVGLTFDDGLYNFIGSAWPTIRDTGFSATVYVPTNFVGGASEWYSDYGLSPQPMLSWDDLRRLRDDGVDIQSHGCAHRHLTTLGATELSHELEQSREMLRSRLEVNIDHFCYPFGDFDGAVKAAAVACGYQSAVTTRPGRFRDDDDPFEIKRESLDMVTLEDRETAARVMTACVHGSYSLYINARDALRRLLGTR